MKKLLFILCFFLMQTGICQSTVASDNWAKLAKISYEKSEDEYGEIYLPKFDAEVKKMAGKRIILEGFIIPFDGLFEPNKIIISSLPIASCFFCGGSGPETVAQVYLRKSIRYTAKAVQVTGTLKLNNEDFDQLMYILEDAEFKIL